jgi:DNA-binding SARP family transcriptional activator
MRFAILGALAVTTGQRPVAVTAARERAILARLLLSPNTTVSPEHLIEVVWEDRAPARALGQLHACVSRLRRRLADGGLSRSLIATAPAGTGYSIIVGPGELDSLAFTESVSLARAALARDQREAARRQFRRALGLWRGSALEGVGGRTIRRLAAVLDERRLQAQQECLTLEVELGRIAEALPELTDLAARHPYHEPLHRLLMLALYRAGRQADAAEVFRRFDRSLREELGTEPGEQLGRLHQAILRRDPSLEPAPATGSVPVPRELPTQVLGFTGRQAALAALTAALPGDSAGPVTVLALTGSPGVGKTALAVNWAHRIADRFPDGQLFVNLRGSHPAAALPPATALAAMLRSLGVSAEEIPDDEARAAAVYRSLLAGRRALILLDDAGSAEQIRQLLPGSGGCAVLVTSRDRLGGLVARDGARRLPLDVLTAAEAHQLLSDLLGQGRVAAEPDPAAALADACARLPLALRIATAHLADRPGTAIADYLAELRSGDRLAALRMDGDEASSVSAALGLSYQALPADAARLLRLLGLVPGPDVTAEAAARLVDADPVPTLARLVRSSLLTEPAPGRYALHDLLREFAVRLSEFEDEPSERDAARERLFRHYLLRAEAAAATAYDYALRLPVPAGEEDGPPARFDGNAAALAWLDAELPNLVAAVNHAARHGPHRFAWLLADRLRGYFWYSRRLPEWLSIAGIAAACAERAGELPAEAMARLSIADAHQASDRHEESISHFRRAAELARRAGWRTAEMAALNNLGTVYIECGRLAEAAKLYQDLVKLDGSDRPLATHLHNLAVVESGLGRLADSYSHYREALERYRAAGDRSGECGTLVALAVHRCLCGQIPEALTLAAKACQLATDTGNPFHRLLAANALGSATREDGDPGRAIELHREAYQTAVRLDDRVRQAEALRQLAEAELCAGDLDRAGEAAEQALLLTRKAGAVPSEGLALHVLAEVRYRQGGHYEARQLVEQALVRLRATGQRLEQARALAILALVCRGSGRAREAERHQRHAEELLAATGGALPARFNG